jgi:hypothetical protein
VKRLAAALLLIALTASPAVAVTDRFSSSDLSGYVTGGAPGWYVEWGRLAHTYGSKVGFVELVRRADLKKVEADLTLSPGRSNAGLTVLWKNHRNHLWAKLEITPGNRHGLISIGRRRGGRVKSLLARSRARRRSERGRTRACGPSTCTTRTTVAAGGTTCRCDPPEHLTRRVGDVTAPAGLWLCAPDGLRSRDLLLDREVRTT